MCEGLYRLQSSGISEDWEGYPADSSQATSTPASLLGSGCKKRAFEAQTLTGVSVGTLLGSWAWKQDGGLGECDKKGRRLLWKSIRLWNECLNALGELQGPGARRKVQN